MIFTAHLPGEGADVLCHSRTGRTNRKEYRIVVLCNFCKVFVRLKRKGDWSPKDWHLIN